MIDSKGSVPLAVAKGWDAEIEEGVQDRRFTPTSSRGGPSWTPTWTPSPLHCMSPPMTC